MRSSIPAIFADVDALDPDRFIGHLSPGVVFRFGNADPVVGVDAVRQAVTGFFAQISGMTHHIREIHQLDDVVVAEIDVEYVRHDGQHVVVPNADVLVFDGDEIASWRIYIDLAPVFA